MRRGRVCLPTPAAKYRVRANLNRAGLHPAFIQGDPMFVTPAYAQAAGGGASAFATFIPLILIFAIMYLLLIRPQQKKL